MKKETIYRILRIVITLGVFIIFLVPLFLIYLHIYPPRLAIKTTPEDYGILYDKVTIHTSDGIELKGWYLPKKITKGTIIVCHGVGANKADIMPVAKIFYNAGYDIYLFDFRGHGNSGNAKVTFGFDERKDIKAIVNYIKTKGVKKIGIYGISMGGGIVMLSLQDNPEIAAVIIDSSYASVEKVLKYRIKKIFPEPLASIIAGMTKLYAALFFKVSFDELIPVNIIDKINRPIMFIAGDKDTNITPDNTEMLFEKAKEPKELLIIKGAGHIQTIYSAEFKKRIVEFMNRYLIEEKGLQ